jgi:hypothetical protein
MKYDNTLNCFPGALWGLNPDHPANGPLIAAPKDASKFLPRDPQTPLTPKATNKKFNGFFKSESPLPDSLDLDGCSTLSGEDLSRRSYTPLSTRHPEQVSICCFLLLHFSFLAYSNPSFNCDQRCPASRSVRKYQLFQLYADNAEQSMSVCVLLTDNEHANKWPTDADHRTVSEYLQAFRGD